MKISEDEVIQENLPNLHKYLGRIDEDDTDAQKTALAKPAVHVIPDNVDQSIIAVWVDTNLILAVTDDNPDTDDVKRVFVGRMEIITPEMQHDIKQQLESGADIAAVAGKLARRGRFADAVIARLRATTSDPALKARIAELAAALERHPSGTVKRR